MNRGIVLGIVLGALMPSGSIAAEKPTVVCLGDSITRSGYPAVLGELLKMEVVNAGIGGNTSAQGLKRIDKLLEAKPAAIVIFFGTNDSVLTAAGKYKVALADYEKNLRTMVDKSRAAGAKVVVCTLPPIVAEKYYTRHPKEYYDPEGGLTAILQRYRAAAQRVGASMGAPVVDLYGLMEKDMAPFANDGVHPDEAGRRFIAEQVAAALRPLLAR